MLVLNFPEPPQFRTLIPTLETMGLGLSGSKLSPPATHCLPSTACPLPATARLPPSTTAAAATAAQCHQLLPATARGSGTRQISVWAEAGRLALGVWVQSSSQLATGWFPTQNPIEINCVFIEKFFIFYVKVYAIGVPLQNYRFLSFIFEGTPMAYKVYAIGVPSIWTIFFDSFLKVCFFHIYT